MFAVRSLKANEGIMTRCLRCQADQFHDRDGLVERFGEDRDMEGIAVHLVCQTCGAQPNEAWISWAPAADQETQGLLRS